MGSFPTRLGSPARLGTGHRSATLVHVEYLFLAAGVAIGVLLGTIVVAFAAVGSYDRGFEDGSRHFVLTP